MGVVPLRLERVWVHCLKGRPPRGERQSWRRTGMIGDVAGKEAEAGAGDGSAGGVMNHPVERVGQARSPAQVGRHQVFESPLPGGRSRCGG